MENKTSKKVLKNLEKLMIEFIKDEKVGIDKIPSKLFNIGKKENINNLELNEEMIKNQDACAKAFGIKLSIYNFEDVELLVFVSQCLVGHKKKDGKDILDDQVKKEKALLINSVTVNGEVNVICLDEKGERIINEKEGKDMEGEFIDWLKNIFKYYKSSMKEMLTNTAKFKKENVFFYKDKEDELKMISSTIDIPQEHMENVLNNISKELEKKIDDNIKKKFNEVVKPYEK